MPRFFVQLLSLRTEEFYAEDNMYLGFSLIL